MDKQTVDQLFEIQTSKYVPPPIIGPTSTQQDMPPFTTRAIEWMLLDYQVQLGMSLLSAPILKPTIQIKTQRSEVQEFINTTVRNFWRKAMPRICPTGRSYGIFGAEVLYELGNDGNVHFKDIRDIYPLDLGLLHRGSSAYGITVKTGMSGVADDDNDEPETIKLWGMKGFIYVHRKRFSTWIGRSDLRPAYEPWLEKTNEFGAKHAKRLWFSKCAFTGGILLHPSGTFIERQTDGTSRNRAYRDVAREALQKMMNGSSMAFDNISGELAKTQGSWDFINPTINGDGTTMIDNIDRCDLEILRGMGIPDDILSSDSESGSGYAGRRVPVSAFFIAQTEILQAMFNSFQTIVLDPLLALNFGIKPDDYEIIKVETDPKTLLGEDEEDEEADINENDPNTPVTEDNSNGQESILD